MQENIDLIRDQLRGAWRFRWIALAVTGAICFVGWAVVFMLPDRYAASARVYVDTRTALSEVTKGLSVEISVENQIERVRQMMLGLSALQKVGDETDLFRGAVTPREKQLLMDKLRKEVTIKSTPGAGGGGTGVYVIEYQNRDRDMSVRVVDKLLNTFLESTIGGKREGADVAQEFLEERLEALGKRLAQFETNVAEFKKKNFGVMPGAAGDYYSRMTEETSAAQKLDTELDAAIKEGATLQEQLRKQERYVSGESPAGAGGQAVSATAQGLREAQKALDRLEMQFTDKHPQVLSLRETVADLTKKVADENAAARSGDSAAAASAGLVESQVYQEIQRSKNQNERLVTSLRERLRNANANVDQFKGRLNMSANVEAEYTKLIRDYDVTNGQYKDVLQRLERARMGEEAEEKGVVTRSIIDPPTASIDPVAPKRPFLIAAVLAIALGAGGGIAYLLHLLRPVFFTPSVLTAATGLPVIGVVPRTWLDRHRMALRREMFQYAGVVSGLVLFAILVIWQQARLTDLTKGFM